MTDENQSLSIPQESESGLASPRDPECVCHGNWRALVRECAPLMDRRYVDKDGNVWNFFGLVHGEDDYYYGMWREGHLSRLSCVGNIESFGYTLLDKPKAGNLLPEPEIVKIFSPENGFTDKAGYPYVEGEWVQEKGAEAFVRALNRSEAWHETRRLITRLKHQAPSDTDEPQRSETALAALKAAEEALAKAASALSGAEAGGAEELKAQLAAVQEQVKAASQLFSYYPKEHPYVEPPDRTGVPCPHCNATGKETQVYDEATGWSAERPCETCQGAGRLYTVEQYLKTLAANWHKDSSLETWFPITAEELRRLRAENEALKSAR